MAAATAKPALTMLRHEPKPFKRLQKVVSTGAWANTDGTKPPPLESRFSDIKKRLVSPERYDAVQKSWERLLAAMEQRVAEIEREGPKVSHMSN